MQSLRSLGNDFLTENILKILAQSRIVTILDFLNEEVDKICAITKLSLPQVLAIRSYIFEKFSSTPICGTTLLNCSFGKQNYLSTGLESLDAILDGGLSIGYITEICGLSGSGKSQLCFQVAINCVRSSNNTVLYIDTKGDFSAIRIQKILDSYNLTHKKMAEIMFRIKVVHVWSMEELIQILQKMKCKALNLNQLSLIIIDSLPSLMFQHLGDETKTGLSFLNTFVNYCRFISSQLQICIVCVNIHTRWIDQDVELEDDNEQPVSTIRESTPVEKLNRCLGKYWQSIPIVVLVLEKSVISDLKAEASDCAEINISVVNNTNKIQRQCNLKLSAMGVSMTNL